MKMFRRHEGGTKKKKEKTGNSDCAGGNRE